MEHYIVDLKDRSYPILIGSGILTAAAETALNSCGGTPCRVCVAGDSHVRTLYSQRLEAAFCGLFFLRTGRVQQMPACA